MVHRIQFLRYSILLAVFFLLTTVAKAQEEKESAKSLRIAAEPEEKEMADTASCIESSKRPCPNFRHGQTVISPGIGLGSVLGSIFENSKTTIPPISATLDISVNDRISLGGYAGISKISFVAVDDYGYTVSGTASYYIIGARGAYHFKFIDHCDTYLGLMVGYNAGNATVASDNINVTAQSAMYSTFLGCRYYFSRNTAAFLELGYGIAIMNLGISMRL
jgi:hypothetical protein